MEITESKKYFLFDRLQGETSLLLLLLNFKRVIIIWMFAY